MFCNQCEQTSKGKACTRLGICGKNEAVAIQQDKLVWQLRELAAVALMARDAGIVDTATDDFAFKALFSTLTNVNFDPVSLRAVQEECLERTTALAARVPGAPAPTPLAALDLRETAIDRLSDGEEVELPIYDFANERRSSETEAVDLQGGVCIVEGIHALNPELTGLVPAEDVYRIYAGLREEYAIDGRRVINTQDIRLCRRTLRDAAARGRSPEKTLAMWDRVLDGETRYIKGFKTTADFLLDTSFTYELGLISRLLGIVRRQFTLEGHNAELWDETARRFEHVVPLDLELLPADSMLREFYGSAVK